MSQSVADSMRQKGNAETEELKPCRPRLLVRAACHFWSGAANAGQLVIEMNAEDTNQYIARQQCFIAYAMLETKSEP